MIKENGKCGALVPLVTADDVMAALQAAASVKSGAVHYEKQTSARRIFIEDLRIYVSPPLHIGNKKIARNVAILSLLEYATCPNCKECKAGCYAHKATIQYCNVRVHRTVYSWLAMHDAGRFFQMIIAQLNDILKHNSRRRVPVDTVRIHEAGDFFSQHYLEGWAMVAALFPVLKFYFYTETEELLNFAPLVSLPNVNKVSSRLPDGSLNFAPEKEIQEKAKRNGVHICPCGSAGWRDGWCGDKCKRCHTEKCMAFIQS